MRSAQTLRTFYILILTQTFSLIGSRMTGLAIGIKVFNDTEQATPLALTAFFGAVPSLISASVAGVLADRWDRRYVMMISDAGQAVGTLLLLASFASGVFEVWHLYVVSLIQSVFGGGMGSRIFVCVMISIFPIVTNTLFGLTSVEPAQHDLFSLQKAGAFTRLVKLQFPAAMPSIFTGYRISAGLSVIGVVVGEQFFREGAKPGLGVMVEQFRQKARFPQVYGGLIIASLLGIAVFFAFGAMAKAVIGHWHESDNRAP